MIGVGGFEDVDAVLSSIILALDLLRSNNLVASLTNDTLFASAKRSENETGVTNSFS